MAGLDTISNQVNIGGVYLVQLVRELREKLEAGCDTGCEDCKILCLLSVLRGLQYDIRDERNTELTQELYRKLLLLTSGFDGSFEPDPHVEIPDTNIVVTIEGYTTPQEIGYEQMSLDGTRYDNPNFAGLNPYMMLDNTTWLRRGIDYELIPTGGFILSASGNVPAIYPGQVIRAIAYEKVF